MFPIWQLFRFDIVSLIAIIYVDLQRSSVSRHFEEWSNSLHVWDGGVREKIKVRNNPYRADAWVSANLARPEAPAREALGLRMTKMDSHHCSACDRKGMFAYLELNAMGTSVALLSIRRNDMHCKSMT